MIVAPCSIHTLSAIAASHSDNLLLRAADVHLKERRRLVLAVRESPLHLGHIKLMAAATKLGAIIAPTLPAFYLRPQTVGEIVEQCARRIVDALALQRDTRERVRRNRIRVGFPNEANSASPLS
jgi:flavin prenyltransferase